MNIRHDSFAEHAVPAAPVRAARRLDEARLIPLTGHLTAIFFDRSTTPQRRPRLSARLDGHPVPPPSIGSALALQAGGLRHLMLLMRPLDEVLAARAELLLDGEPQASAEPDWLQPPVHALPALVAGLSRAGRAQFLKMMLTTGASLFAGSGGAEIAALARQLLDICAVPLAPALDWTVFGAGHALSSHGREAGPDVGALTAIGLLPDRLLRLTEASVSAEPGAGRLHLHLGTRLPEGAEAVIFTPEPLRLPLPAATLRPQPLALWLEGRSAAVRGWALGRVRAAAVEDPAAEALLRELRHPELPVKFEVLSALAVPGGLLHAFRLADPERLVRAIRLDSGGAEAEVVPMTGPEGTALCAGLLPLAEADESEPCRIQLVLGSGRLRAVAELRPAPYRGGIPAGFAEAWAEAQLTPDGPDPAAALAEALAALPQRPVPVRVQSFGPARDLRLSLIAPLGANPDLVAARAAAIGIEPRAHRIEVVLTAPEGPAATQARSLAASAAEVHGIPHRVVAHAASASPAEVMRAALALCPGAALLVGPDVLPTTPGWLAGWLRHLTRTAAPVTAGAVLDHDGAIAEATSTLGAHRLERPLDGLAATRLPLAGETALVSADCAGLSRAGVALALAAASGQPDAGLALTALAGGTRIDLRTAHPFIRFGTTRRPEGLAEAVQLHGLRRITAPTTPPEESRP